MLAFYSFGKRFNAIFFCFHTMFCRLHSLAWTTNLSFNLSLRVSFFDKFESITCELRLWANFKFESLSHNLLQISMFCRFWFQNCAFRAEQLQPIAFCWVEYCIYIKSILKLLNLLSLSRDYFSFIKLTSL